MESIPVHLVTSVCFFFNEAFQKGDVKIDWCPRWQLCVLEGAGRGLESPQSRGSIRQNVQSPPQLFFPFPSTPPPHPRTPQPLDLEFPSLKRRLNSPYLIVVQALIL